MWLTSSSIGRKFVMALTGICLVLFVTFHVLMNSVALIWPAAYNQVCEFLGANWYALIASAGLGLLFIIHIVYALVLTVQNRRARGNDRYAIAGAAPGVEWSSKNMLVLGIVVLAFLVVHLIQFWAKMQLQELLHHDLDVLPQLNGVPAAPAMGTLFIQLAFQSWWTPVVYIIGFIALWFHMNHGFWSMLHTIGWDNNTWLPRLKCIACWWTSIVIALFIAQAIVFTVQAHRDYYLNSEALQEQYAEVWEQKAEALLNEFRAEAGALNQQDQAELAAFFAERGEYYATTAQAISEYASKQAPAASGEALGQLGQFAQFIQMQSQRFQQAMPAPTTVEVDAAEEVITVNE
ncbi:MAG: hypothetical protein K2M55_08150 [Muribaculaceae bacterium]|nr:hypothetical protein [Muribaculaceae bacterium]